MNRQLPRNISGRLAPAILLFTIKVAVTVYLSVFFLWFCSFYSHQVSSTENHQKFVEAACDGYAPFLDSLRFYTVGQIARTHLNVYDEPTQFEIMRQLTGSNRSSPVGFGEYTPFFCVAAIPFTFMPIERACLVSSLLWLSLATLSITVLTRRRGFTWWQCGELLVIILSSVTAFHNCQVGQISFLLLSMVAAYGMFLFEGNEYVAGVILGLLLIKPQYAIMLAAAPLVGRKWKTLIAAAITLSVMLAISCAYLGWQIVASYPSILSHLNGTYSQLNFEMIGIRGFFAYLIADTRTLALIGTVGYASGFALCLFLWKKAYDVRGEAYRWAFAATLSLDLLFGPHSMFCDFVILGAGWAVTISPRILSGSFDEWRKTNLLENIWSLFILLYPGITWLAVLGLKLNYLAQSSLHRGFLVFLSIIAISRLLQIADKSAHINSSP